MFIANSPLYAIVNSDIRVGLLSLPWDPPETPSAALGIIKSILLNKGILCDCFYLNKEFYEIVASLSDDPVQMSLDRIVGYTHTQIYNWLFAQMAFDHNYREDDYLHKYFAPSEQHRYRKMRNLFENKITEIAQQNWFQYSVLGFSCSFYQIISSLALSRKIAQQHNVKIVFGGAEIYPGNAKELIRECPWIDAIFLGYSEYSFAEAITRYHLKEPVDNLPGIITANTKTAVPCKLTETQFNELPMPNYDEFYAKYHTKKCRVEGSRGCWWSDKITCSFCGLISSRFQIKNKVLNEVDLMFEKYGVTDIEFCDLVISRPLIEDLCSYNNNVNMNFRYNIRVDSLLPNEMDKLGQLRKTTKSIFVGVESLHPEILKLMKKGHTVINAINLLKWCQFYQIRMEWFLLFGILHEEGFYYDEMCNLMKNLTHFDSPSTQPILLARNSPYYRTLNDLIPPAVSKYIFPNRFDAMQMSWEFELTNWNIMAKQIQNYKHINRMIVLVQRWKIEQASTSLIKNGNIVHDNRNKQDRIELTNKQSEIIDLCYIPQKKRVITSNYITKDIDRILNLGLIVKCDGKYLAVTTPECSVLEYSKRFRVVSSN